MAHDFRRARDIDVGEWNYLGSHEGIPPLGNNAYSCPCSRCKTILSGTSHWTKTQKESIKFDVRVGDRVLVHRNLPGIVKYVGDLDNRFTNGEIYVGVNLDDPVGEHDGLYDNKRFFRCPEMHGVMVPIEEIHIIRPFDGRNLISESPKKYFSMPQLGGDVIRRRRFKSRSSNKVKAPSFVAPPPSRSGHLIAEKANEVTISQRPSCTSKSNASVESLTSILHKNPATMKAKSVSFALTSSTEKLECVPKAKSAEAKLCGKNGSKTTRQQSKSKDKSSLTTINKARSAFATSDRVVTTPLKPARSEGSQQMSKSVTGPRLMPRRSRSSPIKLEALKPHDEMKSVSPLPSITSEEDMLMQQTSSTLCFADKKHSVRNVQSLILRPSPERKDSPHMHVQGSRSVLPAQSSSTISVRCKTPLPTRFSPLPPLPPLPAITDVHKNTQTVEAHLQPQPSYTNRLLSSLPPVGTTTPLSATTQLNDVKEFGDWVSTWGGGLKGWAMAQTLQKLKDAQRKGEKEVKWQRAIDELEKDPYFASQIQHIKTLRKEIAKVRSQREETEKQLKEKKFTSSKVQKNIEKVQAEIKATAKECQEILHKINTHPLAAMVSGAKKLLFGN